MSKYNIKIMGGTKSGLSTILFHAVGNHLKHNDVSKIIWVTEDDVVELTARLSCGSNASAEVKFFPPKVKAERLWEDATDPSVLVVLDVPTDRNLIGQMKLRSSFIDFTMLYTVAATKYKSV